MTAPPAGPSYLTSCPNCGAQLQPVLLDPTVAPWVCVVPACRRGWFACELTAEARKAWVSAHRSHTPTFRQATLDAALAAELAGAHARGSSARPEQLAVLDLASLNTLAALVPPGGSFHAQVQAAITARQAH